MPKDIEKLIGVQIAKIRKEREITQEQLAESVDVATETISRLERGVSIPSLKTLAKISQAFHTSLKDLFEFEYPQKSVSAIEKSALGSNLNYTLYFALPIIIMSQLELASILRTPDTLLNLDFKNHKNLLME